MKPVSALAWTAFALWAGALVLLGMRLPGYSQAVHPVALPGASGVPGAWWFNTMVFVAPGVLMAVAALRLRAGMASDAGAALRIGASLLLLSALAFAAQGMWVLDPEDLDAGNRVHASAWTAWWIAFVAGGVLLAAGERHWRVPLLLAVAVVLATGPLAAWWLPGGIAQRIAFVGWFAGVGLAAGRGFSRGAASSRG